MFIQSKALKNIIAYLGIFVLASFMNVSFAVINKQPLPADQAFKFSAIVKNSHEILATWKIAPNYYLYRARFIFQLTPNVPYTVQYPQALVKEDPHQTKIEVYSDDLIIPLLIKPETFSNASLSQPLKLHVEYQGCSKNGFCYPPIIKIFTVDLKAQSVSSEIMQLLNMNTNKKDNLLLPQLSRNHQDILAMLHKEHFSILLLMFVGLGILLAFTPCVLPMVPILTGIIVGQDKVTTRKAFFLSLTYVMATAITYALAGITAAAMGSSLQVYLQQSWIIILTSGLFVLLALSLFGFYDLRLPNRLQNRMHTMSNQHQGGTYVGVFFMGVLSTLIISPCVTAPFVGILLYISQTGDLLFGGSALFALGLGMGLPLLVVGISAEKWLPKRGPWMEAVKKFFGLVMLAMAIWLLTRVISSFAANLAWTVFALGAMLFLSQFLPRLFRLTHTKLNYLFSALIGLASSIFILNIVSGLETPINWIRGKQAIVSSQLRPFKVVHSLPDLKKQLEKAQAMHKPVILDFYADWCESCIAMDRNVFNKPTVQQKLAKYTLLRADLSANTAMDEAVLRHFDVIAPPTVLFFNTDGQELNSQRIVGEVNANEFLNHMTIIWKNIALKTLKQ